MRQRGAAGPVSRAYAAVILALHPIIPVIWVVVAVAATVNLPGLGIGATALEDVVAEDSEALATQEASARLFGTPFITDVAIVMRNPDGLTRDEIQSAIDGAQAVNAARAGRRLGRLRGALPIVNVRVATLDWPESTTTVVTFLGIEPSVGIVGRTVMAERYAERFLRPAEGSHIGVTGASPARVSQFQEIERALPLVTLASVALVFIFVGWHFRSVGAPLVTLAAAAISYAVSVRVLGWAGEQAGLVVPREVEPVLIVLLVGIVTDYAIFFLSGMRASLAAGRPKRDAMREATVGTARIILTAGLIVAAGTGALIVGRLDFFQAFGPGLALTALVSVAVCITLIPALMAIFGRRLFGRLPEAPAGTFVDQVAPPVVHPSARVPARLRSRVAVLATAMRMTRYAAEQENRPRWRIAVSRLMASRPIALPVVLVTTGALVLAATPVARLDFGLAFVSGLPAGDPVRESAQQAVRGFAPGILSPTEVLLRGSDLDEQRAELTTLQRLLERQAGVAQTIGPREEIRQVGLNATVTEAGDAARIALVLEQEPDSSAAIEALERLERRMPALIRAAGLDPGVRTSLGGETKLASETVGAVVADLFRIALAALVANLVLLAIFMRALIAPLYLLASSVLAFAASLGMTVWILEQLGGTGDLTYFVPLATAVLLVSLGSDYNVFVAGRIWAEARRRRLREAVAVAAPKAAGTITIAAVTLAATFALLAIVELRSFREFALLMAIGVLVDAVLVRSLLIPGLISLFGEFSWWPGRRVRPPDDREFYEAVGRHAPCDDVTARRIARATLETLGERLSRAEAGAVQRQLPKDLQDTMQKTAGDAEELTSDEFLRRVAERADISEPAARECAIAVFAALHEFVDEVTIAYVRAHLSEDYDAIVMAPVVDVPDGRGATRRVPTDDAADGSAAEPAGYDPHR